MLGIFRPAGTLIGGGRLADDGRNPDFRRRAALISGHRHAGSAGVAPVDIASAERIEANAVMRMEALALGNGSRIGPAAEKISFIWPFVDGRRPGW